MSEAPAENKGKRKGWFKQQHIADKRRRLAHAENVMKGFIFTCDPQREKLCVKDAYYILNRYVARLYPELEFEDAPEEQAEGETVSDALEKELKDLKKHKNRHFFVVDTGCKGVVFIKIAGGLESPLDPIRFTTHIMEDFHLNKEHMSRFCCRMLPAVHAITPVSKPELVKLAETIITPFFSDPAHHNKSYTVEYKCRNNSSFHKQEVVDICVAAIGTEGNHRVNYKQPDYTIIFEINKSIASIAVVEKYMEYKRFNIQTQIERKPKDKKDQKEGDEEEEKEGDEMPKGGDEDQKEGAEADQQDAVVDKEAAVTHEAVEEGEEEEEVVHKPVPQEEDEEDAGISIF
eukprot:GILI01007489.1.p1 GENE.GILI01007489.1~~GILI01007489.1.p1  ORF type:complete len:377 (+),score=113.48 GILI01007489.1:96-1133(+)